MNMNTSFFLEGVQGNDVVARLISLSSCGDMSGGRWGRRKHRHRENSSLRSATVGPHTVTIGDLRKLASARSLAGIKSGLLS